MLTFYCKKIKLNAKHMRICLISFAVFRSLPPLQWWCLHMSLISCVERKTTNNPPQTKIDSFLTTTFIVPVHSNKVLEMLQRYTKSKAAHAWSRWKLWCTNFFLVFSYLKYYSFCTYIKHVQISRLFFLRVLIINYRQNRLQNK